MLNLLALQVIEFRLRWRLALRDSLEGEVITHGWKYFRFCSLDLAVCRSNSQGVSARVLRK